MLNKKNKKEKTLVEHRTPANRHAKPKHKAQQRVGMQEYKRWLKL